MGPNSQSYVSISLTHPNVGVPHLTLLHINVICPNRGVPTQPMRLITLKDKKQPDQANLSPTQRSSVLLPSLAKTSLAELIYMLISCYQLLTADDICYEKDKKESLFMSLR